MQSAQVVDKRCTLCFDCISRTDGTSKCSHDMIEDASHRHLLALSNRGIVVAERKKKRHVECLILNAKATNASAKPAQRVWGYGMNV